MKVSAWLPILILVAVMLATSFSWYLSSPERQYLFDGEKGISRPWVADWWTVKIPVAFALGVVASGTLIGLLRLVRIRAWGELVASVAVAVLGVSTLGGSIFYFRQQIPRVPVACVQPSPGEPRDTFLHRQWLALSRMPDFRSIGRFEPRFGEGTMAEGRAGITDHPGFIPFDPFVLDRLSFVGLTYNEIERLLGPPNPTFTSESTITYSMIGFNPYYQVAYLQLSFGAKWTPSDIVRGEHVRLGALPRY